MKDIISNAFSFLRLNPSTGQSRPEDTKNTPIKHRYWDPEEIECLLEYERMSLHCRVNPLNSHEDFQTIILGVNVEEQALLLDEIFPDGHDHLGEVFRLRLNNRRGSLVLTVEVERLLSCEHAPLLHARIIDKQFSTDRRTNMRVKFSEFQAPNASVTLPLGGTFQGKIQDLSTRGFKLLCCSAIPKSALNNTGDADIAIDTHLTIKSGVKFVSLNQSRKPYHHTTIRALFCTLADYQHDQIQAFLLQHDETFAWRQENRQSHA